MSANPIQGAGFYADPAGLGELRHAAKKDSPEALREAARQFESLFTKMMLKSMREASFGDELTGSDTTDFYQDMHDTQLALELSKGRGLGLADMLVRQLLQSGSAANPAGASAMTGSSASAATDRRLNTLSPSGPASPMPGKPSIAWPPASREDFVRELRPYAEQAGRELGVDPATLIAHAALETGWGRSVPNTADGACSFNLFGIKAGKQWPGATVGVSTVEFEGGLATRRIDRFRAYESPADCFKDYAALIGRNDRYASARQTEGDVAAFAEALQKGGYATDPDYAHKLTSVAASLKSLLKYPSAGPLQPSTGEE